MVTVCKFSQDHNQAVMHRADYFKPFWESKKGNWELIYPDIEDIKGLNCMLTVKCLDCGTVIMRCAQQWLIRDNQYGCSNCYAHRVVAQKVEAIKEQGFEVVEVLSTKKVKKIKGTYRIYTMRCLNCGLIFSQYSCNLNRWIRNGAKCLACLKNGTSTESEDKLPPDAVRKQR